MSGTKKKHVLDWPIVPSTWPVTIGNNLSKKEALALEDVGFQLQQREAFFLRRKLSAIATLPIPRSHFRVPPDPNTYPTSRFLKSLCQNPANGHKNKWDNNELMDRYYVVGVTTIPYP